MSPYMYHSGESRCASLSIEGPADPGQAYNKQTRQCLSRDEDDLPDYTSPAVTITQSQNRSQAPTPAQGGIADGEEPVKKAKGKKWKLEEVERWTMVKRIW